MSDKLTQYQDFLESKKILAAPNGFNVELSEISTVLFPYQRDIVRWACSKGRAAVFLDTGLGKTLIEAEIARLIFERTQKPVLIAAPLSVAHQTVEMVQNLLGWDIQYTRAELSHGVNITNFEMVDRFNISSLAAFLLDESSRLKHESSRQRQQFINKFQDVPYRFAFSATPSPNDLIELGGHSEFLGVMKSIVMRSAFFYNNGKNAVHGGWDISPHGKQAFYSWLSSWSMSARAPSDLGYSDDGFELPPLNEIVHKIDIDLSSIDAGTDKNGNQRMMIAPSGLQGWNKIRKATTPDKIARAVEIIKNSDEQWIVWCWYNHEQDEIEKALGDECVSVMGKHSPEEKRDAFLRFINGDARVLVTKVKIAGHGMNFQHSHNMMFVGLNFSYEQYYQAVRRQYRYGQKKSVNVHIVLSSVETEILLRIKEKGEKSNEMLARLIGHVQNRQKEELGTMMTAKDSQAIEPFMSEGDGWRVGFGDNVPWLMQQPDDSIDLFVTSPPFAESLFVYNDTELDMSNARDTSEFLEHFRFAVREMYRTLKPGRCAAIHCMDIPAMQVRDGRIGLKDFSGDLIRLFEQEGFSFQARIAIDKNQQAQSIRTRTRALSMSNGLEKDRAYIRPALPDYILKFSKPGQNERPIANTEVSRELWIDWAAPTWANPGDMCSDAGQYPTWYGIAEGDTINSVRVAEKYGITDEARKRLWKDARASEDRRHVCPLQVGTILRCIVMWSLPGEVVCDPFSGIGSTGVVAVTENRRYLGFELKPEYHTVSLQNLEMAASNKHKVDLFSMDVVSEKQSAQGGAGWLNNPGELQYFNDMKARLGINGEINPEDYRTLAVAVNALKALAQ
jgi:DNA modification methylase/superfamily II DNA or RNA helicase